ncbi:hypothetical protein DND132_2177 [Pseudodesulfovibrio mercurii]|uniref:Uncharacterized protein n=1 Tax=Pseudodesulfovibrio mercurii TaxID=641491 RepID=F0JI71_9BACT|nr:hypothetical protein [Pseudodesulfovibrio mercurii]EGB15382.1 hypothetical protein DND132_2177 [Pseudodesulfovibrio mercurii]
MPIRYEFMGRAKLIKGYSYPVKRSELDAALEQAGIHEPGRIFYSSRYDDSDMKVLSVFLMGESQQGYRIRNTPVISAYSVPANQRPEIRRLLERQDILPRIAAWLKRLEDATNVIRGVNQEIIVFFTDAALSFKDRHNKTVELP